MTSSPPDDEGYLLHVSRRAMACVFEVCLNAGQYPQGTEQTLEALDLVNALEERLSFFRPDSELSRVNRQAAFAPVQVEPDLFALLELALRLSVETGGAADITATPLWEAWGFARRAGAVPTEAQIAEALELVGSRLVHLDAENRTVRFATPGVSLNLGSMGKGYALDRCAEKLQAAGIEHFLMHGGASSVLARGHRGVHRGEASTPGPGWTIGLPHPLRRGRRLGEIRLDDRALGTSGAQAQSFWHEGRRYGHILDPRTGRPAQNVLSATVVAPSAVLADALSTAFYVMEPDAALDYCRARPELGVVLLCPARRRGGVEIKTAGLGEDDLRLF